MIVTLKLDSAVDKTTGFSVPFQIFKKFRKCAKHVFFAFRGPSCYRRSPGVKTPGFKFLLTNLIFEFWISVFLDCWRYLRNENGYRRSAGDKITFCISVWVTQALQPKSAKDEVKQVYKYLWNLVSLLGCRADWVSVLANGWMTKIAPFLLLSQAQVSQVVSQVSQVSQLRCGWSFRCGCHCLSSSVSLSCLSALLPPY